MADRIGMIIRLIREEAEHRTGMKDYVSKLHDIILDVDIRVGALMKQIRDREREEEKKEGGE